MSPLANALASEYSLVITSLLVILLLFLSVKLLPIWGVYLFVTIGGTAYFVHLFIVMGLSPCHWFIKFYFLASFLIGGFMWLITRSGNKGRREQP